MSQTISPFSLYLFPLITNCSILLYHLPPLTKCYLSLSLPTPIYVNLMSLAPISPYHTLTYVLYIMSLYLSHSLSMYSSYLFPLYDYLSSMSPPVISAYSLCLMYHISLGPNHPVSLYPISLPSFFISLHL